LALRDDQGRMKVLNLRCANGHGFEGWFGSEDDFLGQNGRGLVECPLCADKVITRMPSAPRLNLSGAKEPRSAKHQQGHPGQPADASSRPAEVADAQAERALSELHQRWLKAVKHTLENTEDVGDRFAEEARRIHYGESQERGIRGVTSQQEREALQDEGIEVMALPLPAAFKGSLQ
jgi:hypothetical protein